MRHAIVQVQAASSKQQATQTQHGVGLDFDWTNTNILHP
jgi:hypothetical protein